MYKQKKMCNNAQKSLFFPICKLPLAHSLISKNTVCVCEGAMIRTANNLTMGKEFQFGKTFIFLCGSPLQTDTVRRYLSGLHG